MKIPKMNPVQKLSFIALNILASIILALEAINSLFKLDLNSWVMASLLIATSVWLMSQGGLKVIQKLTASTPQPRGLLHVFSFAIGLVLFFIAISSFPIIGNLVNMSRYAIPVSMVLFIAMLTSVVEIFV